MINVNGNKVVIKGELDDVLVELGASIAGIASVLRGIYGEREMIERVADIVAAATVKGVELYDEANKV